MTRDEFRGMAIALEGYHDIFSSLWEMGMPVFTESITTAAIVFSSSGEPIQFLFNPKFWEELPRYDRDFVVCHEMLHVILNHGFRSVNLPDQDIANIAADLAVNHLLISRFGFVRELLRDWENLVWVDTVFRDSSSIPPSTLTFEEFYELIRRSFRVRFCALADQHLFLPDAGAGSLSNPRAAKEVDALLQDLGSGLLEDLISELGREAERTVGRGDQIVGITMKVAQPVPPKIPWESIVRRQCKRSSEPRKVPGWVFPDRRFAGVHGVIPPGFSTSSGQQSEKHRQKCVFFIDASGSVWDLRNRFFAVAASLPEKEYEVILCSFYCSVYLLDLAKPEIKGGGGTSFAILEKWIVSELRGAYPDVVFVLTDGMGDLVRPKMPERWHWLLTMDYRQCVPSGSAVHLLSNFW